MNTPAKFHPDPIWNDGALGSFWWASIQQKEEEQDGDQFLIQKLVAKRLPLQLSLQTAAATGC